MGSNTNNGGGIATGVIQSQSNSLAAQNSWNNAVQQRNALMNSYPYEVTSERMLNIIVKQVENGYIIQVGNRQHVASDLKEITDLLTNRVAATLLEWNP
jgi:hypothetical protein